MGRGGQILACSAEIPGLKKTGTTIGDGDGDDDGDDDGDGVDDELVEV